ncbi:MAG: DUF1553 domain-containing protein [Fuerstiella sp.]|nr:DUF1553 domain-containing protein [Fuerstiella sp.]
MRAACLIVLSTVIPTLSAAADELQLLPSEIHLMGPDSQQRVLAEWYQENIAHGPANDCRLTTMDTKVAVVEDGIVRPVSNGSTELQAFINDKLQATVRITVTKTESGSEWSFRNHVQPILTRLGCNSGACHGALAGKGGFRLSLRGYDPEEDHFNMTQQHLGRRIDPSNPGMSLVLVKPTAAVAHKGGKRMDTNSLNYRVISDWIASGSTGPRDSDATLKRLDVLPSQVILGNEDSQRLLVVAHYSDGHTEDVSHWTRFTSSDETVAHVDTNGIATIVGPGKGAVTASFGSEVVISRITVAFEQTVDPRVYEESDQRNFIDELVLKQLRQLNLEPSGRSTDEAFIRRTHLNTIGVLPTSQEVREFLADESPAKRDALIERLLGRPEFVDYWTYQWSDVLMINGNLLHQQQVKSYYNWLRGHVENNTPWDEMVRELVTSKGSGLEYGATNFYALHQKPEDMAENVSQAFMGLSIGCARCHNHPLEKWTNDQYYAFANLFSRVRGKGWSSGSGGDGKRTLVTVATGELTQPRTGKPQPPTPLDGTPVSFEDQRDRRKHLADWLVSEKNTMFARSITNRVWKNFMGVGLVEQVDDMRGTNPASNEELLAALAAYLVREDYNLKSVMRQILRSETYQRSSETLPTNRGDSRHYSRSFPRRLMAEVMLDAVSQVTSVATAFTELTGPGGNVRPTDFYSEGTRAIQLYDSAVDSYFLKTFGRNQRRITCECERSNDPSMVQVLHISNGKTLNEKLTAENNRITEWQTEFEGNDSGLLDEMFLTALSRFPQDREREELQTMLIATMPEDRRQMLEDILWGMLSSREFLFTH